jgi:hypothetical protein
MSIEPIMHTVLVKAPLARAFDLFTEHGTLVGRRHRQGALQRRRHRAARRLSATN